jgi:hypothetical protein
MSAQIKQNKLKVWVGLGLFLLLLVGIAGISIAIFLRQDRQSLQYPGAVPLSNHVMRSFPTTIAREDISYRSHDDFPTVTHWYAKKMDNSWEFAASGGCSHVSGNDDFLFIERSLTVTVCETPNGRMIFVRRTTSIQK